MEPLSMERSTETGSRFYGAGTYWKVEDDRAPSVIVRRTIYVAGCASGNVCVVVEPDAVAVPSPKSQTNVVDELVPVELVPLNDTM